MPNGHLRALLVVVVHPAGVPAQGVRRAQHHIGKVPDGLHQGGLDGGGGQDQPVHLVLLHQGFDIAALALGAVGDDDLVAPGLSHLLDGKQAAAEEPVAFA